MKANSFVTTHLIPGKIDGLSIQIKYGFKNNVGELKLLLDWSAKRPLEA